MDKTSLADMGVNPIFVALFIALICQLVAWKVHYKNKNADTVDIAWAIGVALVGLFYFLGKVDFTITFLALLLAPILWYLRLGFYLFKRYKPEHEDGRYRYLRQHWQKKGSKYSVEIKFFLFFIFQALLAWFFSLPAYLIINQAETNLITDLFALCLILVSLSGVTLSDTQLLEFKKVNKGEVCDVGLWRYSRHPNYFFEWLHWCAYPILGWYSSALSDPYWWLLLSYPIWMFIFLWKVTGIPFNEQQNIRSKGDKYRKYQLTTNAFFPGKPKAFEVLK